MINTFGQRTGIPMLLNTSFNENELIVCTPEEAILRRVANANACFLRTDMDVLVLGSYYVEKIIVSLNTKAKDIDYVISNAG